MKKIDKDGLTLCTLQGKLFASSLENTFCSSEIFIRRFMISIVAKEFDSMSILDDSLTENEIFYRIEEEFGKTDYGKVKYEREVLFWIGYIYRYFAYTYNLSSKQVYKIIKTKELNELYYVYHTFDPELAIERILEEKNISFNIDDQNNRLLKMLRISHYKNEVHLEKMTTEYAHCLFKDFKNDCSLFNRKEDFIEYHYSKEKIDTYVDDKEKKGYILFAIFFKEEVIGEIRFKKFNEIYYELGIVLKDDCYKNKGIGTIAIDKSLKIVKEEYNINNVLVEILKNNERSIHVFKKLGFEYDNENNDFVILCKTI